MHLLIINCHIEKRLNISMSGRRIGIIVNATNKLDNTQNSNNLLRC